MTDTFQTPTRMTSAYRLSWEEGAVRILRDTIANNKDKPFEAVSDQCWEAVKDDETLLKEIFDYWCWNNYRRLPDNSNLGQTINPNHVYAGLKAGNWPSNAQTIPRRSREEIQKETAIVKHNIVLALNRKIEEKVKIRMLTMVMPNGKMLLESVKEELEICGGWLGQIAAKLKPGQTVAEANLSEEVLKNLYEKRPAA
jgi:hypothetical protein